MTHPSVSVVIPAFNAASSLARTIESVTSQTIPPAEVIVVDDGSSDATLEVARAQADRDRRIHAVSQANGGASAARNAGIEDATGEFVAFLDADDLWLPDKLEKQLEVFASRPSVMAIQSGAVHVDPDLRPLFVQPCVPGIMDPVDVLRFRNLPAFPTTLIVRREAFRSIGRFDTTLPILEDWEFSLRASLRVEVWSIEECLALYRVHPGNRSRDLDLHIEPGLRVLRELFQDPGLPADVRVARREAYAHMYLMFAGGSFRVRRWGPLLTWGAKAIAQDPRTFVYMASLPIRRVRRRRSRNANVAASGTGR